MNLNKFTEKAQEAVVTAQNLATELRHAEITPEHLLVALTDQEGGIVPSVLRKMGHDPAKVATEAHTLLESQDRKSTRLNSSHVSESRMPSSA